MACPNCDHTLEMIDLRIDTCTFFWCSRCGTFLTIPSDGNQIVYTPRLVERCRTAEAIIEIGGLRLRDWHVLGIRESINKPGERVEFEGRKS